MSIWKNTASILFGNGIRMASSFLLVVIVARRLGSEVMGKYSFILSLFWIFQTIASMGIQPLIIREVTNQKAKTGAFLVNASFLGILAALLMGVFMILFTAVAGYPPDVFQATFWTALALVFSTAGLIFQSVFIAHEKMELVLAGMSWENASRLLFGCAAVFTKNPVVFLAVSMALSSLAALAVNFLQMRKHITVPVLRIDPALCRWMLGLMPTFAGISIFNTVFWNTDVLLLSKMTSMEELGHFGAATRLVGMFKLILQSYKVAIQPVAAQAFTKSKAEFQGFFEKSLKYILLLTIPAAVAMSLLAVPITRLFFGAEFLASVPILRIYTWLLIPYGAAVVFATFLIASHRQKVDLRINAVSTVACVLMVVPMILKWRSLGAGAGVVLAVFFFMAQQWVFTDRQLFRIRIWGWIKPIVLASAGMGLAIYFLRELPLPVLAIAGLVLYFGILTGTGSVSWKELRMFLLKKKTNGGQG
jgi:O-antigen/teichoic acid export membrane protein